jgi:hypothetical protein
MATACYKIFCAATGFTEGGGIDGLLDGGWLKDCMRLTQSLEAKRKIGGRNATD